jgi:hypothetical protein
MFAHLSIFQSRIEPRPAPVRLECVAFTVAVAVVVLELGVISYIRYRYMDTPIVSSAVQVVVGGLVFAVGILIGSS